MVSEQGENIEIERQRRLADADVPMCYTRRFCPAKPLAEVQKPVKKQQNAESEEPTILVKTTVFVHVYSYQVVLLHQISRIAFPIIDLVGDKSSMSFQATLCRVAHTTCLQNLVGILS